MAREWLLLALAVSACGDHPDEVARAAFSALEKNDLQGVLARIDPKYSDPLGDKAKLSQDLGDLIQSTGRISVQATEISVVSGDTRRTATVIGRLDFELAGEPTWRMTGPLDLDELDDGGFKISGNFLTDLRDVMHLTAERRAALEANDASLYGKLLHPTYRDGDVDREDTAARIARDLSGHAKIRIEPTLYKLEVRGPLAHLDEHYKLTLNDKPLPPSIARLTLRPAAGFWKIAAGLYPEQDQR